MHSLINAHVLPGTTVHTDEYGRYEDIADNGYRHVKINHSAGVCATADGAGVNAIESFWALLKRRINGTHVHFSGKNLSKYLEEFEYLYNMRHAPRLMLDRMMVSFAR